MAGDGSSGRTAYELYRDTVIHDMRSKYSLEGDGSNEDSLGAAMAREHGLLQQGNDAANVSQTADAAVLKMWMEADPSVKDFFQHAANELKKSETSKFSDETGHQKSAVSDGLDEAIETDARDVLNTAPGSSVEGGTANDNGGVEEGVPRNKAVNPDIGDKGMTPYSNGSGGADGASGSGAVEGDARDTLNASSGSSAEGGTANENDGVDEGVSKSSQTVDSDTGDAGVAPSSNDSGATTSATAAFAATGTDTTVNRDREEVTPTGSRPDARGATSFEPSIDAQAKKRGRPEEKQRTRKLTLEDIAVRPQHSATCSAVSTAFRKSPPPPVPAPANGTKRMTAVSTPFNKSKVPPHAPSAVSDAVDKAKGGVQDVLNASSGSSVEGGTANDNGGVEAGIPTNSEVGISDILDTGEAHYSNGSGSRGSGGGDGASNGAVKSDARHVLATSPGSSIEAANDNDNGGVDEGISKNSKAVDSDVGDTRVAHDFNRSGGGNGATTRTFAATSVNRDHEEVTPTRPRPAVRGATSFEPSADAQVKKKGRSEKKKRTRKLTPQDIAARPQHGETGSRVSKAFRKSAPPPVPAPANGTKRKVAASTTPKAPNDNASVPLERKTPASGPALLPGRATGPVGEASSFRRESVERPSSRVCGEVERKKEGQRLDGGKDGGDGAAGGYHVPAAADGEGSAVPAKLPETTRDSTAANDPISLKASKTVAAVSSSGFPPEIQGRSGEGCGSPPKRRGGGPADEHLGRPFIPLSAPDVAESKVPETSAATASPPTHAPGISSGEGSNTPTKRGRGRPRKYLQPVGKPQVDTCVATDGAKVSVEASSSFPLTKRGRGRARKTLLRAKAPVAVPAPGTSSGDGSNTPTKRGRGRPPTYHQPAGKPFVDAPVAIDEAEVLAAASSSFPLAKRGRGRPRKVPLPVKAPGATPAEGDPVKRAKVGGSKAEKTTSTLSEISKASKAAAAAATGGEGGPPAGKVYHAEAEEHNAGKIELFAWLVLPENTPTVEFSIPTITPSGDETSSGGGGAAAAGAAAAAGSGRGGGGGGDRSTVTGSESMPAQRCLTDCGRVRADHAHPKDDGDGTGDSDGIGKGDGITEKAVFGVLRQQEATVEVLWDVEIQTPGQPTEQKKLWFTATVDLTNPCGTDEEGNLQWKTVYDRVGGRPKEKTSVVFLTKDALRDGRLEYTDNSSSLQWREKRK